MLDIHQELVDALRSGCVESLAKLSPRRGRVYGRSGKTLLHLAAKYSENLSIIYYCVNTLKIKVTTATLRNRSLPIHISCKSGNIITAKFLLEICRNSIETTNHQGESPLSICCKYKHTDLALYLIQMNADINSKNIFMYTPLHWACITGNHELAGKLIDAKARFLDKTNKKETCLHLAVESGCFDTVKLFIPLIDNKTMSDFGSIFQHASGNHSLINFLCEHSEWARKPKLIHFLNLKLPGWLIVDNCRPEFSGDTIYNIQLFNRTDIIQLLFEKNIFSINELLSYSFIERNHKCKAMLLYHKKILERTILLFTYKNLFNRGIGMLPKSIFIELIKYLS